MSERKRLPDERASIVHHFQVADMDGYIIVGMYQDGKPGELFIKVAKEGSTVGGLLDALGIVTSIALQHGVPLNHLTHKLRGLSFEPSGLCPNNDKIHTASSLVDYIFHWLELRFKTEGVLPKKEKT